MGVLEGTVIWARARVPHVESDAAVAVLEVLTVGVTGKVVFGVEDEVTPIDVELDA